MRSNKGIDLRHFPVQLTKYLGEDEILPFIEPFRAENRFAYGRTYVVKSKMVKWQGKMVKRYAIHIPERRQNPREEIRISKMDMGDLIMKGIARKKEGIPILKTLSCILI